MTAVARVVQNASSPVAKLIQNRHAAAGSTPPPGAARRARPPDAERDGRLGHAPEQPQHDGGPVLQVLQPRGAQQRAVTPQPLARSGHASSPSPCANAWRITSSMGGSSIDRSATGSAARRRALVPAASSRRTSSTALGKRKLLTVPNVASVAARKPAA